LKNGVHAKVSSALGISQSPIDSSLGSRVIPDFDLLFKKPMHGRRFSSLEELSSAASNQIIRQMNRDHVLDGNSEAFQALGFSYREAERGLC